MASPPCSLYLLLLQSWDPDIDVPTIPARNQTLARWPRTINWTPPFKFVSQSCWHQFPWNFLFLYFDEAANFGGICNIFSRVCKHLRSNWMIFSLKFECCQGIWKYSKKLNLRYFCCLSENKLKNVRGETVLIQAYIQRSWPLDGHLHFKLLDFLLQLHYYTILTFWEPISFE